VGRRGWLPKLFDHTSYSDISQHNHLLISSPRNFVIIMMYDHGQLSRLTYDVTVTSGGDSDHA